MKTRQQKLKDIDFWITVIAICLCGISLIITVAVNLYTATELYWPVFILLGVIAVLFLWKMFLLFFTIRYDR